MVGKYGALDFVLLFSSFFYRVLAFTAYVAIVQLQLDHESNDLNPPAGSI